MSNDNKGNVAGGSISIGGGFTGLLTIVFIVLKLCGVIDWSWVWVLSPLWISVALFLVITIIVLIVVAIINRYKTN